MTFDKLDPYAAWNAELAACASMSIAAAVEPCLLLDGRLIKETQEYQSDGPGLTSSHPTEAGCIVRYSEQENPLDQTNQQPTS